MLAKCHCDAVSIVTPDHLHGDIAVACAQAGKDMLIEKPIATNREDVHRIVDAANKHNVRVMVDLHNRWSPPFSAAKEAIEAGELGEIQTGYFRLNDIKCNILGSKGMVAIDASNHNLIQKYTDTAVQVPDILVRNTIHGKVKGFAYESIRSFVDKIISDEPFIVTMEDAAKTSLAILSIMESAENRMPVDVVY